MDQAPLSVADRAAAVADSVLAPAAERMADVLASLGTAVEVTISDGDHDRVYWRSQATAYTEFYGRILAQ